MKIRSITNRISNVLLYGVLTSSIFIIIGIVLSIINNEFSFDYTGYNFNLLLSDLRNFSGVAYLLFGIFILILTPIIRVIGMLIQYLFEKNYKYVYISILILIILSISLLLGITGH